MGRGEGCGDKGNVAQFRKLHTLSALGLGGIQINVYGGGGEFAASVNVVITAIDLLQYQCHGELLLRLRRSKGNFLPAVAKFGYASGWRKDIRIYLFPRTKKTRPSPGNIRNEAKLKVRKLLKDWRVSGN